MWDSDSSYGKVLPIFQLDKEIRAPFIINASYLDDFISRLITAHFCSNDERKEELFGTLMTDGTLTFKDKIDVLKSILERHYPNLVEFHIGKVDELFTKLDNIRRFRNRLAHAKPDTSQRGLDKVKKGILILFYHEDGIRKEQPVTEEFFREKVGECLSAYEMLKSISPYIIADSKEVARNEGSLKYANEMFRDLKKKEVG